MKKIILNLFIAIILVGCATPPKHDGVSQDAKPIDKVGQAVGEPMLEAKSLLYSDNAQAALEKINQAEAIPNKTLVEEKIIYQYKMVALMKLRDSDAVEAMVNAQRTFINPNQWGDILKFLHAGFASKRNYPKAVLYGERYLVEIKSDFDVLEMVARSYYLQGNYQAASKRIKELIRQIERSGKKPGKEIYEVWLASSYKLNDSNGIKRAKEKILMMSSSNGK